MKCGEAAELLTKLISAEADERVSLASYEWELLKEMESRGLVTVVKASADEARELHNLRDRLEGLRSQRETAKSDLSRDTDFANVPKLLQRIEFLNRDEDEIRRKIIGLSEAASVFEGSVDIDGKRYAVTYKGRDLAMEISSRLPRVSSWDIGEFEEELERLIAAFDTRARNAASILREISPKLREVDEIHLRAAAVGLSIRNEPPAEVVSAYIATTVNLRQEIQNLRMSSLTNERCANVAEHLCSVLESLSDESIKDAVHTFASTWWNIANNQNVTEEEALRCALMLYSIGPLQRQEMLQKATILISRLRSEPYNLLIGLAAAVLLTGPSMNQPGVLDRFLDYRKLTTAVESGDEADFAAAILAIVGGDDQKDVQERFGIVKDYLTRFTSNGMMAPAAMLTVLSPNVAEVLGALRIASAKITQYRMSLGGMENLSLGVKALLGTSLIPVIGRAPPAPAAAPTPPSGRLIAVAGLVGLALATPVLLPALLSFHDTTLHRLAVTDFSFHPVHTHYIYG